MRHQPFYDRMTVDQFLAIDFGSDRKFELIDGLVYMMTGGTPAHSRIASNILIWLGAKLRGTGCRAYNANLGIRVDDLNCRYPDVSVFCGNPATPEREESLTFDDPVVIFVLSPSTQGEDLGIKLLEYRSLTSIDTIVYVDPIKERARVLQRLGPTAWRDDMFAQPNDVDLPALGLVLPHAEIFARD